MTLSGQFQFNGTLANLADRIGAISSMREVRYWSADKKAWRPLVNDASALASPDPLSRRDDFKAGDMNKGARLYYRETDEADREAVYRLDVMANSSDSLVLANENITPIKRFVFTIFKPSTLQSVLILQRLSANTFGVYMLNRTDKGASSLSDGHEKTYVNHALALYRKLAGVKPDLETPPDEWNAPDAHRPLHCWRFPQRTAQSASDARPQVPCRSWLDGATGPRAANAAQTNKVQSLSR